MNESQDGGPGTQNLSRTQWMGRVVADFEAAWRRALEGGPRPQIPAFLVGRAHDERAMLRRELETIDREFQQRLIASQSRLDGSTAAIEDAAAKRDTDPSMPSPTIALNPDDAPRGDATQNLSPGKSNPPIQDATLNLDAKPVSGFDATINLAPNAVKTPGQVTEILGDRRDDGPLPTVNLDPNAPPPAEPDTMAWDAKPSMRLGATVNLDSSAGVPTGHDLTMPLDGDASYEVGAEDEKSDGEFPEVAGYKLLGVLGRGGMGVVYRARHIKLDRIVALKMVIAGAHAAPEQLARFYTEAQAVAHLQHPTIIQIYEVGEQEGLPYFSLEFVDGGSLAQKCAGKPQPDKEAAQIVETLARGMHYAHQHGVVHRDLKPANILLMSDGSPKITDFGLAKRLETESSSQTRSGAILGTPSYMAPEQALGEVHQVGPLTDVYSLGAILYELITGRPPFLAPNPMDTVMQVIREEPVAPKELQPAVARDLETICLKCLQKEQAKRYSSAETLAEDLRRFQAGEPITARPVGNAERFVRWCRRNPKIAALSAAVVFLLVSGTIAASAAAVAFNAKRIQANTARQDAERNEQIAVAAKQRAEKAEGEAKSNELLAKENAELANQNAELAGSQAELATEALKTVVSEVDAELRDRPKMQPIRTKILEKVLKHVDEILSTERTVATLDRARAAAYLQRSILNKELSPTSGKAYEDQQEAHKILLKLATMNPQGEDADKGRGNLALSFDLLGDMVRSRNPEDARSKYLDAQKIRQDLFDTPASEFYEKHTLEHFIANSYDKLGETALAMGDPVEAERLHQQALEIRLKNFSLRPELKDYQQSLAATYFLLSRVSNYTMDWNTERERLGKCVAFRQKLVDQDGTNITLRYILALTFRAMGDADLYAGDPEAAESNYRATLEHLNHLVEIDGRVAYRIGVAAGQYRLGAALLKSGGAAAADPSFQTALKTLEELFARGVGKTDSLKKQWMVMLARCGRHEQAATLAQEVGLKIPLETNLVDAACGYSLCIAGVAHLKSDDELTPEEREKQKEYAKMAIECLTTAIEKGYKNRMYLANDPDLEAARKHPGYAALFDLLKAYETTAMPRCSTCSRRMRHPAANSRSGL
jgi:serine/threonine-protein kinase